VALAENFSQTFREEHRQVRDALLDLVQAFQERDKARIDALLTQIAVLTGPHFRYEEEALYPSLTEFYGEEYVEKLLGDHDRVIGTAHRLIDLAGRDALVEEDVSQAVRHVRSILPHVSDCDGLSIMVERLPEEKIQGVFQVRDRALAAGLDLLTWAASVRARPAVVPA